jgi:uncharacterized lipoprotein YddW (UPF0748 family)
VSAKPDARCDFPWENIVRSPRAFGLLLILIVATQVSAEFNEWRGLWLTRFDYQFTNEATVRAMVDNAATLGITDLMFQVRGQGDAFYNSNFEPRAASLAGNWDPLAVAIDQANSHGINLHAWINTMPLWNGTTAPPTGTTPSHPFYETSPSHRVHDLNGNPQPLTNGYVIGNPISQAWHDHVNNVVDDILTQYDVAGVHLDYTRWLGDTSWTSLPHDAASHQMFTAETGLSATSNNANEYRDFIKDRITDLVGSVKTTVDSHGPEPLLSAAVWRDPDVGSTQVLQKYRDWMQQDLVDVLIPMIYLSESNNHLFQPNLSNILSTPTNARIAPGLGVYLHDDPSFTVSQLQTLLSNSTGGANFFGYSSFFESGQLGDDRVQAILDFYHALRPGDFNQDGQYDTVDIDALTTAMASGTNPPEFDLDGNGQLTINDLVLWLAEAGEENLPSGASYLFGDSNLDGSVNGADFIHWNTHKFTVDSLWSHGDFNADGAINGADYVTWNQFKFLSADTMAVPEPAAPWWLMVVGVYCHFRRKR